MEHSKHIDHTINYNITSSRWEDIDEVYIDVVKYWLDDNWSFSIVAAILYVILIFGGRKLMESRERFQLRNMLVAWNGLLAIFSTIGAYRMLPNMHYALTQRSFYESVCMATWTELPVLQIWTILFSLSKIVELGDTVFIVLRKQPLILLHWYHHITVLIYTWYSLMQRTSSGRWYITMNYSVHSVMYAYYAARALRYRPPEWFKMFITLFQLSQMVVGVYIAVYVYQLKQAGVTCGVSTNNMRLSFVMYASYFLLFAKFFYDAYIKEKPKPKANGVCAPASNGVLKTKENGHTGNGHLANGATNGHLPNGVANGHTSNGHLSNGHSNGYYTRSKKVN